MVETSIYERYDLHTTSDKFYCEPLDTDGGQLLGQSSLVIDRISKDISLQGVDVIPFQAERKTIYGIIGVIHLVAGPYLLIITGRELVGMINGHKIWKMTDSDILPYSRTTIHLTESQVRENRIFLDMVHIVLKTDGFYYSCTFDLTHSLQRLDNVTPDFLQLPMHERADHRFLWNKHVLHDLILQPETRGSIPLFWSQKPNLKWQPLPKLRTTTADDHTLAFRSHMATQIVTYGGTHVIVNLVNRKGRERNLGEKLEQAVIDATMEDVKYVPFDFHGECKNMNWGRLSVLRDNLWPDLVNFGFFASRTDGNPEVLIQSGYFRSNCMDCLDRTNVVQSMLAKCSLELQLKWLHLMDQNDTLTNHADFENSFKNLWADNGDICSIQYAGTAALKADFTRLGKRTYYGLLRDGINALVRYAKNNFNDGRRQDAIDLFLGNYTIDPASTFAVDNWRDWKGVVLVSLVCAFSMLLLTLFLSTEHTFMVGLFWGVICATLLSVIFYYGEEFVNKPKLKTE